jgi:hypothetical protein
MDTEIPLGLTWGENPKREPSKVHIEWHAPCGCAFHPTPFPHVHPCANEHQRPDLAIVTVNKGAGAPEAAFRLGDAPLYAQAEVDRAIAGVANETQAQVEAMREVIIGLASFVNGDPCWCQCAGGKHSKACRKAKDLPLWRSPSGVSLPWKDSKSTAKAGK